MDIETFNALHMPALEREEARHSLILSLMARAAKEDPPGQTRLWSFGEPGACALQTPGRGLVLGALGRAQCEVFAEEMAGTQFRSVLGTGDTSDWFAARAGALGETFAEPMRQRILALTGAPVWPQTNGQQRPVTAADADLFVRWARAFLAEAVPEDPVPDRSELEERAASGDFVFWTVDGESVSLAGAIRRTRATGTISWVYTPPARRARGYAGAVTASVAEKIYADGRETACLYTDMANPWSNRCYEKIGFREVCRSNMFRQTTSGQVDLA